MNVIFRLSSDKRKILRNVNYNGKNIKECDCPKFNLHLTICLSGFNFKFKCVYDELSV